MKKFIVKFLSQILVILSLLVLITLVITQNTLAKFEYKLADSPQYLVLGHSHPEMAINDSLIKGLKNLSEQGESYFYTYQKVKGVLRDNNSLKTVFIEFTNNQISERMNEWTWGKDYLIYRYPTYSNSMSFDDNFLLFKNNFEDYYTSLGLSQKKNLKRLLVKDYSQINKIGGYEYRTESKIDSLEKHYKYVKDSTISKISSVNVYYLKKIIHDIKAKGIRVVLIRSPLHRKYLGYQNEKVYLKLLKTEFKGIEYLDFSKFKLNDNAFFDYEHLNNKGAIIFSKFFDTYLKNKFSKE